MVGPENLDELKKQLDKEGQVVDSVNVLFLDISSACTGYSIANVNFTTRKVNFTSAGAIWLDPNWEHQEKYCYMSHTISNYFWVVEKIDYIVAEQYSVNPNKMQGINVVSEMQGAIKAAAWENGVKVVSILPQSWRSILKIKRNAEKDYKEPTKEEVLRRVQVPEKMTSNITSVERQTPYDVYDALAIGMAWLTKLGFDESTHTFNNIQFNKHIGAPLGQS